MLPSPPSSSSPPSACSPRAVLGELHSYPPYPADSSSPSSSCKAPSPSSGTIAVGVGLPAHVNAADKENVPPIFDSALHTRSLLTSDDDNDDEDVFAAIERLRREREGDTKEGDEEEKERKMPQLAEDDMDYDPFDQPPPPTTRAVASPAAAQFQHSGPARDATDGVHAATAQSPSLTVASASRPSASVSSMPPPSSYQHLPPPRPTAAASCEAVVEERVSADVDVGGSTPEHFRASAAKKKTTSKAAAPPTSNRAISSFFAAQHSAPQPSPSTAVTASTVPTAVVAPQPARVSMPYAPPPSRTFFAPAEWKKRRREEDDAHEQRRSVPAPLAERQSHDALAASETTVEDVRPQQPQQMEMQPAVEAATVKRPEEVAVTGPAQVRADKVELFTADEDEDDDEEGGVENAAADDIEAQLMDEEEAEEGADANAPNAEGEAAGKPATVDDADAEVEVIQADAGGDTAGEGEDGGEEEEEEGGDVDGNEEEQLAAALLDEAASDDDHESRRAARNLPSALTADLSPSHRSTSSDSDSDSDEEPHDDWQALQAEDDKQRQARLDALHATTERLIRSSAAAADTLKAITTPRTTSALEEQRAQQVVNPMYAKLLERLREKEKVIGAEVGVRFIHDSVEEEKRRMQQQQREAQRGEEEGEREEERRVVVVEKEVDGERMLEIDLDELEEEVDDSDDGEAEDDDLDCHEDEQQTPAASKQVVAEQALPAAVDKTVPLKDAVAEQAQASTEWSPSSASPRLSDVSTDEDSDAVVPSPALMPVSHTPPPAPAMEEEADLVDDEMDDETKAMVRAAQGRRRKRRRLAVEDEERQAKQPRIGDAICCDHAIMDLAPASTTPAVHPPADSEAALHLLCDSAPTASPSSATEASDVGVRRRLKPNKTALLDAEAEDEDVAEGRRRPDADDDDEQQQHAADEYEEDGFITRDSGGESDAAAAQRRTVDAALDAAKDEQVVEALQAKFVTRTGSKASEGGRRLAQRTASTSARRPSVGSASSSPVKAASPVPTPPLRSHSSVLQGGGLLDDDGRPSDEEEEEEVDDNSSARRHKRALLQHRARLLKHTAASSPSPSSSPLRSLSRFDLLDETSLSTPSAHFPPPLSSPLHPPTRSLTFKHALPPPTTPSDFSALHAQIARQRSVVRQNSFLADGAGWKSAGGVGAGGVGGGGGGGGGAVGGGGGVVSVKSVSLSRSYIFRRVSDDMNENCWTGKGGEKAGEGEKEEGKGKGKGGKGKVAEPKQRDVAKTAVQGSAFLSSLARSKTTASAVVRVVSMGRKSSALLMAMQPSMSIR